ncbi:MULTISPECIES: hypothetical protein [unclassified Pseudomonas]
MRQLNAFDWSGEWPNGLPRLGRQDEHAFGAIAREGLKRGDVH